MISKEKVSSNHLRIQTFLVSIFFKPEHSIAQTGLIGGIATAIVNTSWFPAIVLAILLTILQLIRYKCFKEENHD